MRKFGASLLAFLSSLLTGFAVANVLAIWTNADQEYIAVFFITIIVAMVVTVPFFVAQFFSPPRRSIDRTAIGLAVLFGLLLVALLGWTLLEAPNQQAGANDLAIIAGLILPGLVIIATQWLIVRAMQPRSSPAAPNQAIS